MFVEMTCGHCESGFSIDSEEEDPGWMLIARFANAHAQCGYMTPLLDGEDSPVRKVIRPRLTGDPEEA